MGAEKTHRLLGPQRRFKVRIQYNNSSDNQLIEASLFFEETASGCILSIEGLLILVRISEEC